MQYKYDSNTEYVCLVMLCESYHAPEKETYIRVNMKALAHGERKFHVPSSQL